MIGSRIKMHQNDIEWIEHRVKQSRSTSLIAVRCPHPRPGSPGPGALVGLGGPEVKIIQEQIP